MASPAEQDGPVVEPISAEPTSQEVRQRSALQYRTPAREPEKPRELTVVENVRDAVVTIVSAASIDDMRSKRDLRFGGGGLYRPNSASQPYVFCPVTLALHIVDDKIVQRLILITVANVNDSGKTHSWQATVHSFDGALNICFLELPAGVLQAKHPHLYRGKNRNWPIGTTCWAIGNVLPSYQQQSCETAVTTIILASNRHVDYYGQIHGDLLLLDRPLPNCGTPIIAPTGRWIGMHIGGCLALSEYSLRRAFQAFFPHDSHDVDRNKVIGHHRGRSFITTPAGSELAVWYFRKACLGFSGRPVLAQDLYGVDLPLNGYIVSEVRKLTEENNDLTNTLTVGDLILRLRNAKAVNHQGVCPGDRRFDDAPSLCTWQLHPGMVITVSYRKHSENYMNLYTVNLVAQAVELADDYPCTTAVGLSGGTVIAGLNGLGGGTGTMTTF